MDCRGARATLAVAILLVLCVGDTRSDPTATSDVQVRSIPQCLCPFLRASSLSPALVLRCFAAACGLRLAARGAVARPGCVVTVPCEPCSEAGVPPPPPHPLRTKWTRRVPQHERPWHAIFSAKGKLSSYRLFFEAPGRVMDPLQRSRPPRSWAQLHPQATEERHS